MNKTMQKTSFKLSKSSISLIKNLINLEKLESFRRRCTTLKAPLLYEYVIKKQASLKRQKKLQQQFSKIAKSITFLD